MYTKSFLSKPPVLTNGGFVGSNSDNKTAQRVRKSPVEIRFEILEFLFYNAGKHSRTSLWRRATQLSYDDFQKYLEFLKGKGYVEESEEGIRLSIEGKNVYVKLRETLPSIL